MPEPQWSALNPQHLVHEAIRHRVVGLVLTAPGAANLPTPARDALIDTHRAATLRGMAQAADLLILLNSFAEAQVPLMLMKGQAFSTLVYGDWTVRGVSADADFLIPPGRLKDAHNVLVQLGYLSSLDRGRQPPLMGLVGRYNRWLHYERPYWAPDRLRIDLHWRPTPSSAAWSSFAWMWQGRTTINLHGRDIATPGHEDCLRVAAAQAEPDGWPTLRAACDVIGASRLLPTLALEELMVKDRLVAPAMRTAPKILRNGNPRWSQARSTQSRILWRQWVLRSRTDAAHRAAVRSVLGLWLPARRLTPRELHSSHPD